jgi:hypothetical protein
LALLDAFPAAVRGLAGSAFLVAVRLRGEAGFFALSVTVEVVFLAARRRGALAFFFASGAGWAIASC